ncbi:MAG: ferritin-like domain-containing protein [Sphingomonadaceae bacterium]
MPLQNPRDSFAYELSVAHSMEQSLQRQLPQLEQVCQNPQVKQLISSHITDTQRQSTRLEECFRMMGMQPMNVTCHAIDCMQQDFQSFMQQSPSQEIIDMFCLGAAGKSEHFEIATYKGLIEMARMLGETQVVSLLEDTLQEEQRAAQTVEQLGRQIGAQIIHRSRP